MEKKTLINSALLTASALSLTHSFANSPSTDPRYDRLKQIMREYVQQVVQEECAETADFDFDAYEWNAYEILGLEVILFDILNHTKNYCKPPELSGMHSARQNQGEGEEKKNDK